ncbi:hypothetical protein VST7929_02984 [Vibrio stylophorae]|uniref:PaaI family thioesterase n=1 Tax=Vibrio stylophorae TaxID=659351 RepID=A0ABM8ZYJ2_9VIBR|nr:PaaI family thioesterase [Vibrio stylophorae]CAH0535411.1 hypothetical protein VST7929_02984 [Vibrio stylophorae]
MFTKINDDAKTCAALAHRYCYVCGQKNCAADALQLRFKRVDERSVSAAFQLTHAHQGYSGLAHGGMIASVLDGAMTHCLFVQHIQALTAELTVRYHQPWPIELQGCVCATVDKARHGVYWLHAKMTADGVCYASAHAKFIAPNPLVEVI